MNPVTSPPAGPLYLPSRPGEPAWELAMLFPPQGHWTEADYLTLDTNRLVELSDGCLEVLPMPTLIHQYIVMFLYDLLGPLVKCQCLGRVVLAPLPVRLGSGKYC